MRRKQNQKKKSKFFVLSFRCMSSLLSFQVFGLLFCSVSLSLFFSHILFHGLNYDVVCLLHTKLLALVFFWTFLALQIQKDAYLRLLTHERRRGFERVGSLLKCGLLCSILVFFGFFETINMAVCVWSLHLLTHLFRPFTGLQMFPQLAETGAIFVLTSPLQYFGFPQPMVVCQQWFLFRLMLGGGLGKIHGGGTWKELTAMDYHYWTQPLPNAFSSFMHSLPHKFHQVECIITLLVEGPLAILQFTPWSLTRLIIFFFYVNLMIGINATGNFGHLGWVTVSQSLFVLDDFTLSSLITMDHLITWTVWKWSIFSTITIPLSYLWSYTNSILCELIDINCTVQIPAIIWECVGMVIISPYMVLSWIPFWQTAPTWLPVPPMIVTTAEKWLRGWVGVMPGRYVKFGSMTTYRCELIIQVSDEIDEGKERTWRDWYTRS
jgi:hypothetical protein